MYKSFSVCFVLFTQCGNSAVNKNNNMSVKIETAKIYLLTKQTTFLYQKQIKHLLTS